MLWHKTERNCCYHCCSYCYCCCCCCWISENEHEIWKFDKLTIIRNMVWFLTGVGKGILLFITASRPALGPT